MTTQITIAELQAFIDRLERLLTERKGINEDIKFVLTEAANKGYDKKIIKDVIRIREETLAKHEEKQAVLETYLAALNIK